MTDHVGPQRPWRRRRRAWSVWSTVVDVEVRAEELDDTRADEAFAAAVDLTHEVDRLFSPFRPDSWVSRLRSGEATEPELPESVRDVLARCRSAQEISGGAFDPWSAGGRFDPCGYVKGWAADRLVDLVVEAGFPNVCVNAGGDVACRGHAGRGYPWRVGLRHPYQRSRVMRVVRSAECAVATSGTYERGHHIHGAATHRKSSGVVSATVVGPDAGLADALATGLVAAGAYGMRSVQRLPGWSAYLVTADRAQFTGPAFE
ncbi:MAG: FAD:protein FMN transferase [Actinobacteria bacterium]|nr:FAD:protein FMN transferase [Actinomycetota bacterium]